MGWWSERRARRRARCMARRRRGGSPVTTKTLAPAGTLSAMKSTCASAAVKTVFGGSLSAARQYCGMRSLRRTASDDLAPVLER